MCIYNKLIKNRKYTANKKNGGIIPPVLDERTKYVPIGCGKCIECKKQKAQNWRIRLLEDIKTNTNGKFITLTLSNQSIAQLSEHPRCKDIRGYEFDNEIATVAMRYFNERWRKKFGKAIRHWLVTELGHEGTENIHLHGILWTNETFETIEKIWQYGFIWPTGKARQTNYVNGQTINYSVKYVNKIDEDHKEYNSIVLTSPGIGGNYTKTFDFKKHKFNGTNTIETYRTSTGHTMALPIYWRNKAFTDEEREKLWLQRLDKNERWVCGEKVKADDDKTYWALIEWHRQRNTRLGYGNDEKNWNREQYENNRRKLLQEKRIKDGKLSNNAYISKYPARNTKTGNTSGKT